MVRENTCFGTAVERVGGVAKYVRMRLKMYKLRNNKRQRVECGWVKEPDLGLNTRTILLPIASK